MVFKLNFIYYNNIYSLHYELNILLLGNYIKRLYKSECETNKMKFLIKRMRLSNGMNFFWYLILIYKLKIDLYD